MKLFQTRLKNVLLLPLLCVICVASLFGGLVTLNVFPRVNADATATEEGTSTNFTFNVAPNAEISGTQAAGDYTYLKLNDGAAGNGNPTEATTYYANNGSELTFAFDKAVNFNYIKVHYFYGDWGIKPLTSIVVTYSNDGDYSSWQTKTLSLESATTMQNGWIEISGEAVKAKNVMFKFTAQDSNKFAIDEIEIYADKSYNPTLDGTCDNVALNKTVTADDAYNSKETKMLTDGVEEMGGFGNFYGLNSSAGNSGVYISGVDGWTTAEDQTEYGNSSDIVVDLGADTQVKKVRMKIYNEADAERLYGSILKAVVSTSSDNSTYTSCGNLALRINYATDKNIAYWAELVLDSNVSAQYVKITVTYKTFAFFGEIEIYSAHDLEEVVASAATAEAEGVKAHYKCKGCGNLYVVDEEANAYVKKEAKDLIAHGHTFVAEQDSTISAVGYREHYVCPFCDTWFTSNDGGVTFTEVADKTTLEIAKKVVTIEDNVCSNVASGKTVTIAPNAYEHYGKVDLTDGTAGTNSSFSSGEWYGLTTTEYTDPDLVVGYWLSEGLGGYTGSWGKQAIVTVNLTDEAQVKKVRVHALNYKDNGTNLGCILKALVSTSADGSTYTTPVEMPVDLTQTVYWLELEIDSVSAKYVKFEFVYSNYLFINEIEVNSEHDLKEVVEVTPTLLAAGTKAHYECSNCGACYLYNEETFKYVKATAEELVIAKRDSTIPQDCNLARGGTMTADAAAASPYTANALNDGEKPTEWNSSKIYYRKAATVTFAYDKAITFKAINVYYSYGYGGVLPLRTIKISYSNDGINYSDLTTLEPDKEDNGDTTAKYADEKYTADTAVSAKYVKIYLSAASADNHIAITEIEIIGEHLLTEVEEQAPTTGKDGVKEHYECEIGACCKWFTLGDDGATFNEVADKDSLTFHAYNSVARVEVSKGADGCEAHYECPCGKWFTSSDNGVTFTEVSDKDSLKFHKYDFVAAKNAESGKEGVKAHYECEGCDGLFVKDGNNYVATTEANLTEHNYTHVPEVPATIESAGVKEHWTCPGCNGLFVKDVSDNYVTTTDDELVIPKIIPTVEDNVCTNNVAKDKDVTAPEAYDDDHKASLTDGEASTDGWSYKGKWYGVKGKGSWQQSITVGDFTTTQGVWTASFIVDLTAQTQVKKVRVHVYNYDSNNKTGYVLKATVYTSADGIDYGDPVEMPVDLTQSADYWLVAELSSDAQYVKVDLSYISYLFLNEIEVYSAHNLQKVSAKAATIDEEGNIEHHKCSVCGKLYTYDESTYTYSVTTNVTIDKLTVIRPASDSCDKLTSGATITGPSAHKTVDGSVFVNEDAWDISTLIDGKKPTGNHYQIQASDATKNDYIYWGSRGGWETRFIITFNGTKTFNSVNVYGYVDSSIGILEPTSVYIDVLADGKWTQVGSLTVTTEGNNWTATGSFTAQIADQVSVVLQRNGYMSLREIEVLGTHDIQKVAAKAATVTEAGEREHYECLSCGKRYELQNATTTPAYVEVADDYFEIERLSGLYATSMSVNKNFDVNFYAYVAKAYRDGVQLSCTMDGVTTFVDGTALGNGEYKFVFKKVGPQNLGKDITAVLVNGGATLGEAKTFTATTYLKDVFNQGDSEQKRLVADIFAYGAAAQAYLGQDVTISDSEVAAYATTFAAPGETKKTATAHTTVNGFTFTSANIRFASQVQIVFKFQAGSGYKLTVNGKDVTSSVVTDGAYYKYYADVSVVNFDSKFTACLYSGDTLVQTVTYSVNSYVYSMNANSDESFANLVKCLYNYGLSAIGAQPIDRTQNRVNVGKNTTATVDGATSSLLTDGLVYKNAETTIASIYKELAAGSDHTIILDLGSEQKLGAFELSAFSGDLTTGKYVKEEGEEVSTWTIYEDEKGFIFPAYVTVCVSNDGTTWEEVGVCNVTTKNQNYFTFVVELGHVYSASFVKFEIPATSGSSAKYLISEACAYVYSNTAEETDVYTGCTQFSAVTENVYSGTTSIASKNLIKGLIANIEAPGKVAYEWDYYEYGGTTTLFNTPASSLGVLTNNSNAATANYTLSGNDLYFRSLDAYFKFYGYGYRRIAYDLGSICLVENATFRAFHNPEAYCYAPSTIKVLLSMDGVKWYNAGEISDNRTTEKQIHSNTSSDINRLARFVAYEFELSKYVAIDELKVTGKTLKDASAAEKYTRIDSDGSAATATDVGYPSNADGSFANDIYLAYFQPTILDDKKEVASYSGVSQSELEKAVGYHNSEGVMTGDTMFDGILFLISGKMDGTTSYGAGEAMTMTASSLTNLTTSLFCDYLNLKALNAAVAKLKATDGFAMGSNYKVKVYLGLYFPEGVTDGYDFGTYSYGSESVNGISNNADRAKLLSLWIQDVEDKFDAAKFDNIEIGGYYWYCESLDDDQKAVIETLKEGCLKDKKLAWIPYFDGTGASEWAANHFDIASWQPNYAFDFDVSASRIETLAAMAKKYGTAVELELGGISDERYPSRYFEYLTRASELGYDKTVHFYYLGGTVLNSCFRDGSGVGRAVYDATYEFIKNGTISKPQANPVKTLSVTAGSVTEITLVKNAAKGATSIMLREPPKHGSITVNSDGTVTYHAEANYTGNVTFTYAYSLHGVYSDTCTVMLKVVNGSVAE